MREALADLFAGYDLPVQMTGVGSMVEWFFTTEPITDYRSTLTTNLRVKRRLGEAIRRHGVFGAAAGSPRRPATVKTS